MAIVQQFSVKEQDNAMNRQQAVEELTAPLHGKRNTLDNRQPVLKAAIPVPSEEEIACQMVQIKPAKLEMQPHQRHFEVAMT